MSDVGFSAGSQHTGGGICCVILPRKDGGEIIGNYIVNFARLFLTLHLAMPNGKL
jgi:hypothetical protein